MLMTFEALLEEKIHLEEESSELKEKTGDLKDQVDELANLIESRDRTIRTQQNRINDLLKQIYGRRSEKFIDPNQLLLDDIILEAEKQTLAAKEQDQAVVVEKVIREHVRRTHPGRKPLPEHLKRVEHYLDIPEADKKTEDGKDRPLIGVDITERLDYQPCSMIVNRYIRPKYGADDEIEGCGVKQAPAVEGPIDKCMAESSTLAHVIVEKYEHHTPLYRQELKFKRQDIQISRQTMAGWMASCAEVLKPLYERMHEKIIEHDIVLNDDTPVDMLDPELGKTRSTRLWCTVGGEDLKYTMYNFTLSREKEGPLNFFKEYQGHFLCDDYAGYYQLFKSKKVIYVTCWAHVRRYFIKAQDTEPKASTEILTLIAKLYKIEKQHKHSPPEERRKARHKHSIKILKKIRKKLLNQQSSGEYLPQSPMSQAIEHGLKLWRNLCMYLKDGRIPIDNNLAENAIRPIALGRKNWMFFGSENGGNTAAILMSFTSTCRKLKMDTWQYLKDVLQRINTHPISKIDELLPDHWQKQRDSKLS